MKKFIIIGIVAILATAAYITDADGFFGIAIGERIGMYNTHSVKTVQCKIQEIGRVERVWGPIKGNSHAINLTVKTDRETMTVYLGPAWFIERENFTIGKEDIIEVKGCTKMYDGKLVLVAQEIKKDNMTLKLRDSKGNPMWFNGKTAQVIN